MTTSEMQQARAHVVVVGGGFGGWYAAAALGNKLLPDCRVTLVDRNDYLLYTPMLTEAAGRSVSPAHVIAPNRTLPHRVKFVQGEVTAIDVPNHTVTLADGTVLHGDHLVIALGSTTNYRDIEGAREHSVPMKTLHDARRVQATAQRNVERARMATGDVRKRLLSIVVAGGGYTGVETMASVNDLVRDTAKAQGIKSSELSLTLVEPSKGLMSEMPESLGVYGKQRLEKDGVRVLLEVGVQKVEDGALTLTSGEVLPAGLVIWDTGITPPPLIAMLDCAKGKKHGIATDSCFRVQGQTNVWAIGDCAEIPDPNNEGKTFAPTAQNAIREGALVAANIIAIIRGREPKPFTYKQIGTLAVVARYAGVAHVFGLRIKGFLGWLMWRGIYVAKMPGTAQKLGILGDWFELLTSGRAHVSTAVGEAGTAADRQADVAPHEIA